VDYRENKTGSAITDPFLAVCLERFEPPTFSAAEKRSVFGAGACLYLGG
jgi:hypothetical protein